MARQYFFAFFLFLGLLAVLPVSAQLSWYPVDTITEGEYDCYHPSVIHNDYQVADPLNDFKVVFERHTKTTSDIIAHYGSSASKTWIPYDYIISSTSGDTVQASPDIGEIHFGSQNILVFTLVAWQRWDGKQWQIWYSTRVYNPLSLAPYPPPWSAPIQLSAGQANSMGACVRRFNDTTLLVMWKQDSAVVAVPISPFSVSNVETLAVAQTTTFDLDAVNRFEQFNILWTDGHRKAFSRSNPARGISSWSSVDTFDVGMEIDSPRLLVALVNPGTFLFDSKAGEKTGVFLCDPGGHVSELLLSDSAADELHASAFGLPIIFNRALPKRASFLPFDLIVFERAAPNDSSLVFVGLAGRSEDTVRSVGHNRNPVVSSCIVGTWNNQALLTVWESNRTGRSQIYARWANETIDAIQPEPHSPQTFALYQNFPNPFNPTTGIRFQVPRNSWVRLAVYDILSREVAVLVDSRQTPGDHEVRFDGSHLSSGVYFYKLTAESTQITHSMILLK